MYSLGSIAKRLVRDDAELGTSLVTDMSGYDGGVQGFGGKSTFNGDISKWNTAKVTDMDICFLPLLRSTKTLGVGTQRK